jgi:phospholipid/cholesterol/gamma-HCH transport system substrate-binding protein
MKRGNEFLVGLAVLLALAGITAAALWLSEASIGKQEELYTARFRTVGGLGVGAPVTLRGVRVGRVQQIRLADNNWVEADLKVRTDIGLPVRPAVIAASSSLFGEWEAMIVSGDVPQEDPALRFALVEAAKPGGPEWPGATLPDVGQLTAQAGRIAGDIAALADRVETAFDSAAVDDLRGTLRDFAATVSKLEEFTRSQTTRLDVVTGNLATSSDHFTGASRSLENTLSRVDSATSSGQLSDILNSGREATTDFRLASADLRALMAAMRSNEASLIRVLTTADTLLRRMQSGQGTLGLLTADSTLYNETTLTVVQLRQLLTDIQANPRKYFKFSVF